MKLLKFEKRGILTRKVSIGFLRKGLKASLQ